LPVIEIYRMAPFIFIPFTIYRMAPFITFFLFAQKFSLRNRLCRRQRRSWEVLQIAGKLHRGFIPVRGGVRGKLPPDGTLHSQSKISPVAIKGGRESDCECMSQTTNQHRKPQDKPRSRSYRPQGCRGRRKSPAKWGFATAPLVCCRTHIYSADFGGINAVFVAAKRKQRLLN